MAQDVGPAIKKLQQALNDALETLKSAATEKGELPGRPQEVLIDTGLAAAKAAKYTRALKAFGHIERRESTWYVTLGAVVTIQEARRAFYGALPS